MRKKMTVLIFMVVAIAGVFCASAYTTNGFKVTETLQFTPHKDFASLSIQQMNDMMYLWNKEAGKTLVTRNANTTHSQTDYPKSDGKCLVYRVGVGTSKYLANYTGFASGEVDININASHDWANSAQKNKYDFASAFIHEIGHIIGLGHSSYSTAVMYDTLYFNEEKRELSSDDKRGVQSIYR